MPAFSCTPQRHVTHDLIIANDRPETKMVLAAEKRSCEIVYTVRLALVSSPFVPPLSSFYPVSSRGFVRTSTSAIPEVGALLQGAVSPKIE